MILIDMDMPKNCNECRLRDFGDGHEDAVCAFARETDDGKKRPEWCPLTEGDTRCQAYIGDPPRHVGHVDDEVEIKHFIKALETRLKYCPGQAVDIIISAESAKRLISTLKKGVA